jgi:hypothetical protein
MALLPSLLVGPAPWGCTTGEGDEEVPAVGPNPSMDGADGAIRCTYAYRASNDAADGVAATTFEERVLMVGPTESVSETLGQLTLSASYNVAEYDSDSFNLTAAAGGVSVLAVLFQLSDGLPENQFSGGHGFTGLLYFTHPSAGGDYQAFCEAVP